jgi:hypothetical protein
LDDETLPSGVVNRRDRFVAGPSGVVTDQHPSAQLD